MGSIMASEGSISRWIGRVKGGDSLAAEALWRRYFPRLVALARRELGPRRCLADEEDVALSTLDRFCRAAREGRYPDLADRAGLWRLLFRIARRRVVDASRYEQRHRRAAGRTRPSPAREGRGDGAAEWIDAGPTPALAAMMLEEYQRLLAQLDKSEMREIAMAKMEGCSNEEIAKRLDCSVRTVERRLRLIRDNWKHAWKQLESGRQSDAAAPPEE